MEMKSLSQYGKKAEIPIFFACDEDFVKYTMVSMKSIMENADRSRKYHIYILHMGITEAPQAKVLAMADEEFAIDFVDVTDKMKSIADKLPIRDYYSNTTYFRLFIPDMFPQYRKALYIDSDTIVVGNIAELYDHKLGKLYAGVCPDRVVAQTDILGDYVEKVLGVKRTRYFNAGVMLMNCSQFRENHLLDEFLEMLHIYLFVVAQDQDYLNLICKNQVLYMEPKWNAQVFGELACPEEEVGLFHFNMAAKPWHYEDCRLAEYFWKYAKMTADYDAIKEGLANYTDEQRRNDSVSGEKLIQLAVSEINREDNYLRKMEKAGKSESKLALLAHIEELEREGRFSEDAEVNPPAPVLMPEDINYLPRSLKSKTQTKYAFKVARWFVNMLIKKKQLIIKEYKGIENLEKVADGAVITCNHFNAFDSFAIQLAFEQAKLKKKKMYRVIREGNYTGFPGFYGVLMRHCNTLPLSSNFKTMEKFIAAVDRVLEKNQFVLVYPEQGMWWNYRKPRPLQKGAFTFAARNNKPVLPVFITMEDSDVLDDDGFYVQEYTVHFCEPIYPDPNKKRAQNSCEMRDKNYEAWKAVYEQTYGEKLTYSCDEEQPIKEKKAL
ncbi:glycosyltransferase [Thermoguttaceae bacterium LCP21S3_D4]|nr:glycosyltransferase [Lachnospiraceae bacterium]